MLGNDLVLIASIALGDVSLLPNDEVILDFKRTVRLFKK